MPPTFIFSLGITDWLLAKRVGLSFTGWGHIAAGLSVLVGDVLFYGVTRRSSQLAYEAYYHALWLAYSVAGGILT